MFMIFVFKITIFFSCKAGIYVNEKNKIGDEKIDNKNK